MLTPKKLDIQMTCKPISGRTLGVRASIIQVLSNLIHVHTLYSIMPFGHTYVFHSPEKKVFVVMLHEENGKFLTCQEN